MVIEGRAAQQLRAFGVYEKRYAITSDDRVVTFWGVECHLVLQARATTLCDRNTEAFAFGIIARFEQRTELSDRSVGHGDHRCVEISARVGQVKLAAARTVVIPSEVEGPRGVTPGSATGFLDFARNDELKFHTR